MRSGKWKIAIAIASAIFVGWTCLTSASASTSSRLDRPVLLVHGFDLQSEGQDCGAAWSVLKQELSRLGRTNVQTVGFYRNDHNCDITLGSFDQNSSFAEIGQALNTAIADLGPVDLVGYSAGGLVVNDAVSKGSAGVAGYAPLDVSNLVTAGSPLNGTLLARFCVWSQCDELRPDSAYLSHPSTGLQAYMQRYGQHAKHADRTQLASPVDGVVSALSATWGSAEHRVTYGTLRHDEFTQDGGDAVRSAVLDDYGLVYVDRVAPAAARVIAYAATDAGW